MFTQTFGALESLFRRASTRDQELICEQLSELIRNERAALDQQLASKSHHLEFVGLPSVWYVGKGQRFQIRLVDEQNQLVGRSRVGVGFTVVDARGRDCTGDLEIKSGVESRVFSDGVIALDRSDMKFNVVSSKRGGHVELRAHLVSKHQPSNDAPCTVHAKLQILSKPNEKCRNLSADMAVTRMPNIGRETAERLAVCNIFKIADLAAVKLSSEDMDDFQRVFMQIRKSRGRMTEAVLCDCIRAARACVEQGGLKTNDLCKESASTNQAASLSSEDLLGESNCGEDGDELWWSPDL